MCPSACLRAIVHELLRYRFVLMRSAARAIFSIGVLVLAAQEAGALEFLVRGISVSPGGSVNGTNVSIPVGGTVTIGARVAAPGSEPVLGTGASYYGWNPNVLSYVAGTTVDSLFHSACVPGSPGVGGVDNLALDPLVPTTTGVGGPSPGAPNIRVLIALSITPQTALVGDSGLDGVCGGGDAQFRLTFSGVAAGTTTLTIGTGDDEDGIIVVPGDVEQATNATVTVTVPEPGLLASMMSGLLGFGALGRVRTIHPARKIL